MESNKLIYERLARILKGVKAIEKTKKNKDQLFSFRSIDDILNDLHKLFADNEVFIVPETIEYQVNPRTTKSGSILYFTHAKIKFSYTTVDGSSVSTVNIGEAMDSGDKSMNKAQSVALKYSLLQMFLIPTNDNKDPDATTPPETVDIKTVSIRDIINHLDQEQDFEKITILDEIDKATSVETLKAIFDNYQHLHTDMDFMTCLGKRKEIINAKNRTDKIKG